MTAVTHHPDDHQYVLELDDGLRAWVDYDDRGDTRYLVHSEVPARLRGQGVGRQLVEGTFELLEQEGQAAVAVCGYVAAVARRSERWRSVIG